MPITRRKFMQFVALTPGLKRLLETTAHASTVAGYRADLLPSQKELWDWQVWMAKLGPKYTGNHAHTAFVEFLASEFQKTGIEITRDSYAFTRWDAKRCEIKVAPKSGAAFKVPFTSYYPYSGQTPPEGVSGELVEAGTPAEVKIPAQAQGKILFVESPVKPFPFSEWYTSLGSYSKDIELPSSVLTAIGQARDAPMLDQFKKAGALGVILSWTNISDENAAYQYTPFTHPLQDIPALWVGRDSGIKLRDLTGTGAKVTLTLEADLVPDTRTETLIGTLAGASDDEVLIVNTHTDGPNATEENGALGCLALAKYFARLPKADRRRTYVFVLATGHFALRYVPSITGFMKNHPDIIKRTVAALTIEHLGAEEWRDDSTGKYRATGKDELSIIFTRNKGTANAMLKGVEGTPNRRVVVAKPTATGPFFGEGGPLSAAGIPTIGYIPQPDYLLAGPPDCYLGKLSAPLLHAQVQAFARVIHVLDRTSAEDLKE